ncbi:hypothetical protein GCK32_004271, partial [Trichostrongylus colubriformis]
AAVTVASCRYHTGIEYCSKIWIKITATDQDRPIERETIGVTRPCGDGWCTSTAIYKRSLFGTRKRKQQWFNDKLVQFEFHSLVVDVHFDSGREFNAEKERLHFNIESEDHLDVIGGKSEDVVTCETSTDPSTSCQVAVNVQVGNHEADSTQASSDHYNASS